MSAMVNWLKWIAYSLLATITIAILVSGGVVFLAIGAVIGLMVLGGLLIMFVAYLIKEFWEHVVRTK